MILPEIIIIMIVSVIIILFVLMFDEEKPMRRYERLSGKEIKELYRRTLPGDHAKCADCPMVEFCEHEMYESCAETLWWFLYQEVKNV